MLLFRSLAPARVAAVHVYNGALGARYTGDSLPPPETAAKDSRAETPDAKSTPTGLLEAEDATVRQLAAGGHGYGSSAGFLPAKADPEGQRHHDKARHSSQRSKNRRFTRAEDQILVDMRKQDYQYSIIAKKLDRNINILRNRMSRLVQSALVFPSASQVSVEDDSNVGYESGSTGNASTLARKRAGTPWTAQDDAKLLQMHKEGINLAAIAMALGRSTRSVQERQQWTLRPGSRSSQTPLDLSESGSLSKPKRFSQAEKMTVVYHRRCLEWKWVDIARLLPGRKPRVIQIMYLQYWRELYQDYSDEDLRQAMSRKDEGAGQPSRSLPQDASNSNAKRRFSTLCYNAGRNGSDTNSY